jgi:hypothetical protein
MRLQGYNDAADPLAVLEIRRTVLLRNRDPVRERVLRVDLDTAKSASSRRAS